MLQMVLAVLACCACDKAPDRDGSGGMSTSGNAIQPAVAAGGSGGMANASGTNTGGADGASHGSMEAGSPAASGGGGTGSRNAPATSGSGGAANDSGTPSAGDASTVSDAGPQSIPPPVTTPYVWGVGIGITDVPAAVKFYTEVMKMTVEKQDVRRDDRTETVLASSEAMRGSRLVLMNYDDKRSTTMITAKLVWQAPDPTGISTAAANYPGYVSRLAGLIVQFDGPETYIQEVGNAFDTGGAAATVPYMVALGMSTSDQQASINFYTTAFGWTSSATGTFPLTDATGAATVTEYTVQYSTQGGSALVLQSWVPERNSKDNPIKIVLFVPDAQAAADAVVAAGGTIFKPAGRTPVYDNRKLIVAKDLDGYELELVE